MPTIIRSLLVVLAVILSLSACGGGSNDAPPVTPKQPVVAAPRYDVTLTQYATRVVVTPGERVDVTAFNIDCLRMADQHSFCASSTRMGDLGIVLPIGLVDPYLTFKGESVPANHVRDAQGLHLIRSYDWFVWESGEARISAIVSPYATPGVSGGVELKAVSAAIGRSVGVVSGKAEVKVVADPAYEPAEVTSSDQFVSQDRFGDLSTVTMRCGDRVSGWCYFGWLTFKHTSSTEPAISSPRVTNAFYMSDSAGIREEYGGFVAEVVVRDIWVAPGTTATVVSQGAGVFGYTNVQMGNTWSGGKEIYPRLPQYCQAAIVSPETNCKG